MLDVRCDEHLEKVRAEAFNMGIRKNLEDNLHYLETYACQVEDDGPPPLCGYYPTRLDLTRAKCVLMSDRARLSFYFELYIRKDGEYKFWMNGGLIFHSTSNEWSVHT